MHFYLNDDVVVEFIQGESPIVAMPRWDLMSVYVTVGPYNTLNEYEGFIVNKIGAFNNWWTISDEFCFDTHDRFLRSLWLEFPETNLQDVSPFAEWVQSPQERGILLLLEEIEFEVSRSKFKCVVPGANYLACFIDEVQCQAKIKRRIQVSPDLDLLFGDGKLAGWGLSNPRSHIANDWEQEIPNGAGGDIDSMLYEYLQIISTDNLIKMEEKNPQLLRRMKNFQRNLDEEDGVDRKCMEFSIRELIDTYWRSSGQLG